MSNFLDHFVKFCSKSGCFAAVLIIAAACQSPDPEAGGDLPEGAIPAGDDFYMVPAGEDPTGCPWFRPYSRERLVVQVMYYRDEDGGFTTGREQAACPD